jgi:uncharacterized protein YjbI with pentapeptide repeats
MGTGAEMKSLREKIADHRLWIESYQIAVDRPGVPLVLEDVEVSPKDADAFQGVNLAGAIFNRVSCADLDLRETIWSGAELADCSFRNAVLAGSAFNKAVLYDVWFDGADLSRASLFKVECEGVSFNKTNCSMAKFDHAWLAEVSLKDADLSNSSWNWTVLRTVTATGAVIGGVVGDCLWYPPDAKESVKTSARDVFRQIA